VTIDDEWLLYQAHFSAPDSERHAYFMGALMMLFQSQIKKDLRDYARELDRFLAEPNNGHICETCERFRAEGNIRTIEQILFSEH
jgi:flagellar biosynthesis regulator FlbT